MQEEVLLQGLLCLDAINNEIYQQLLIIITKNIKAVQPTSLYCAEILLQVVKLHHDT